MKKRKGFIIIAALVISMALTIMLGAFSSYIFYRNQISMKYINSVKAYYLAASAAQYGRVMLSSCSIYGWLHYEYQQLPDEEFSITDMGDSISIKYSLVDDKIFRIEAKGQINGVAKSLICEEDSCINHPVVSAWCWQDFESAINAYEKVVVKWQ